MFWDKGKMHGSNETKLKDILEQVTNHIPTSIAGLDTKLEHVDKRLIVVETKLKERKNAKKA